MNKGDIKKALAMCAKSYGDTVHCSDCPYNALPPRACFEPSCQDVLSKDALGLITEQQQEIDALKANNEENCWKCIESKHTTAEEYAKLQEEFSNYQLASDKEIRAQVKQAKIDVLTEVKESIKTAIDAYWESNGGGYYLAEDAIDDIEQMIEELKK